MAMACASRFELNVARTRACRVETSLDAAGRGPAPRCVSISNTSTGSRTSSIMRRVIFQHDVMQYQQMTEKAVP
jgi:hypothetical protein